MAMVYGVVAKNKIENGAQIDMLFDRTDSIIHFIEAKFTSTPFKIDKTYYQNLKNKIDVFFKQTKNTKQHFMSLVSANGIIDTPYSDEIITGVVVLDDLFQT